MKKLFSLLLVAALLVGVFAMTGCQKAPEEDNTPITVWQVNDDSDFYVDYNSHPTALFIEEKFGIDLSFQLPPEGGETDAFGLMVSTGDFTDVISLGAYANATAEQLHADGYLRDLAPYLEEHMPNYYKYLQENPKYRAAISTEDGKIFGIVYASPVEEELMWGGMLYRRDILETMTGGNVAFPSGEAEPTTIADWEYMLDLMTQYFQAAGMADYAPLILPANGVFSTGELVSGFGIGSPLWYVKDGEVRIGATEQGYYNYLAKMAEWYAKGWIYKDFASRVNDVFYMPNTALTYGGAAGIWYGGNWQLGGAMSMPDYGLYMDVQPLKTPLDTDNGITECHALMNWTNFNANTGLGITTNCSESKMFKYMEAMDYFFTEEGSLIVSYGLPAEYAKDNETMIANGLQDGVWYKTESGELAYTDAVLDAEGNTIAGLGDLYAVRFPGIKQHDLEYTKAPPINLKAHETWTACGRDWCYPAEIALSTEQQEIYQKYYTDINDALTEFTVKVITGQIELNETTWAEFQAKLETVGINELKAVYVEAYNDFMAKMG